MHCQLTVMLGHEGCLPGFVLRPGQTPVDASPARGTGMASNRWSCETLHCGYQQLLSNAKDELPDDEQALKKRMEDCVSEMTAASPTQSLLAPSGVGGRIGGSGGCCGPSS